MTRHHNVAEIPATVHHVELDEMTPCAVDSCVSDFANNVLRGDGTVYLADSSVSYGGLGMNKAAREEFNAAALAAIRHLYPNMREK